MSDHLLMAIVPGDDYWEAEPVVVRQFGQGSVSFQLEDGSELVFDRAELLTALDAPRDLLLGAEMEGRRRRR